MVRKTAKNTRARKRGINHETIEEHNIQILFIFNITQTIMVRKRAGEQKGDKT